MKTKLIATVLLSVVGLMPVLGGTSYAQSFDNHQPSQQMTISNTVYLPFVSKPPCTPVTPTLYASISSPVIKVGEVVTVTEVLVNDCAPVGEPNYILWAQPEGILTPSLAFKPGVPPSVLNGSYQVVTITTRAIEPGVVTITAGCNFEWWDPPTHMFFMTVGADPILIRVLP